ncbi:hypothetical protein [Helicobacter pametensis]|uniref:hypothetical protein n=1 Tax=Helicobacter pametensis TaxID=95149 RepID=UPI0004B9D59C|nr:hypothetical protein [Helicobacter pametensis]
MEKFSLYEKDNVLETICEYLKTTNIETQYFDSYFEFLNFFQNIEVFDHHFFTIGAYLIYGWMPTIPNINITQEAINTLNKAKQEEPLDHSDYLNLIKSVNNSIVGASKILHFANPKKYPIFDSRIKSFFEKNLLIEDIYKKTYNNKTKEINQYLIYKTLCEEIIEMDFFQQIFDVVSSAYPITAKFTKMRMLENLFFSFDKNSK